MVKNIDREAIIPGVDVTELCAWLKDPDMYKEYHRQYNHNNRITVSEWNVANNTAERDVIFLMPFRGPNILKRAIGTDVIRVHDQHSVTAELEDEAGEANMDELPPLRSVIFESKPAIAPKGQPDIPFAEVKFIFTNLIMPSGQPACKVNVTISCTAVSFPWLWALHSVIEKVMGAQCKFTADGLIEFWQKECKLKEAAEQEAAEADLREEAEHVGTKPKGEEAEQESFQEEPSPTAPTVMPDDVVSIGSSVYHDAEDDLQVPNTAQHTSKKEGGGWKRVFCCFGACGKQEKEAPTRARLMD